MKATLLRGPRSGCLVGMFCSFCSTDGSWIITACLTETFSTVGATFLTAFWGLFFALLFTLLFTLFLALPFVLLFVLLFALPLVLLLVLLVWTVYFLISLISLLHFTKSEIYYALTKMSSGKFLINIHFTDIYHFLLISIITQNAQSNYYYVKCFHHLILTWMIQANPHPLLITLRNLRRGLTWFGIKRIFAIRFATCS